MGVVSRRWVWLVVRRYIDILIIIINFPYSTCISSFLAAASLLFCSFLKCFSFLFMFFFLNIYSKRYSKNIRDCSKKSRSCECNYLIISIIKNVERASTARARESRDFHMRGT